MYKEKSLLIRKGAARDINEYHKELGHPSETITCATAQAEDALLKGKFVPCEDFALRKARQAQIRGETTSGHQFIFNK